MLYSKKTMIAIASSLAIFGSSFTLSTTAHAEKKMSAVEEGKRLAFSRKKGNCLACHMLPSGKSPGNIAPPLVAMKMRYPDKAKLRAQIWDAAVANPDTSMPPFGAHGILSESELDKLVDYIHTL